MSRYYARHDGDRLGPFSREELGQLAAAGALSPEDRLEEEANGIATTVRAVVGAGLAPPPPETPGPAAALASDPGAKPPPPALGLPILIWTAFLAVLSLYLLIRRPQWFVLDWLNLPMHEAGHTILFFTGDFIRVLGGTLIQLAVPLLVAGYFWRERKVAGIQFGLFWFGEACLYASVYAADARAMQLELLGGGIHDWNYLLGRVGLLDQDQLIAAIFVALGGLAFAAAVLWPFLGPSSRQSKNAAAGLAE